MKRLFLNALDKHIQKHQSYKTLLEQFNSGLFPLHFKGPRSVFRAALISRFASLAPSTLVVFPTDQEVQDFIKDASLYTESVSQFPGWGTMLYKGISSQTALYGQRVQALNDLTQSDGRIIVTSLRAALGLVPPPGELLQQTAQFRKGDNLDPVDVEQKLSHLGYYRVHRVSVPGEFALRGEVLDIFPSGSSEGDRAVRIVFDFDTIEEIRYFHTVNQTSFEAADQIRILPTKEILWSDKNIEILASRSADAGWKEKEEFLTELAVHKAAPGEEIYYPLAVDKPTLITSYLSEKSLCFIINEKLGDMTGKSLEKEFSSLYADARRQKLAVPPPQELFRDFADLRDSHSKTLIEQTLQQDDGDKREVIGFPCEPGKSYFGNIKYLKEEFELMLSNRFRLFVFCDSKSQAGRLEYLFKDFDVTIISEQISTGFFLPDAKIGVIQENEIFGRKKRRPVSLKKTRSQVIDSFVDLTPGDPVVHINYGIGLFKGIKRIRISGNERDYISLEYAGDETVMIPIEQVNLIQRYIGQGNRAPNLDKIGGTVWKKKTSTVKKSVEDLADRLIALYARRKLARGYAFPADDDYQIEFEADFPYEETEDQIRAIEDVKKDMESPQPMDRLVCGDVGYGKTEIAMRAAFKGVMGGKQVAVLCPTTILAEQHYENFVERFQRFPVKIGMLSRFVPAAEQKKELMRLEAGELDVLIGTHRILSKDVRFKNIGLLIVDEEQRFGVKHKERLKEIKSSIDSLTLSATPIPRTLHMSLAKIRDMSLLLTPPYNRHPIETFIQAFNEETVQKAVRRELERGGQVFYLHNRVESLDQVRSFLETLLPDVYIAVAHGQMDSKELEDIMHRFIHGGTQVLVSTTIIENGIDIPNVNTIIIDRADMYGVSQLYQLRGRVGRSDRLAYAYLLYPEEKALTELAMKRLQVISDFTDLGSGFKIAMKDLEIRGAGNLLGAEQSGDIYAVGFDMYLHLLEEAIQSKMHGDEEQAPDVLLELDYSGFIPDNYIPDPTEKMEVYKKIAATITEEELLAVHTEIYDRFGPLPDEVESLLSLSEIKILCKKLWIATLRERRGTARITFAKLAKISIDKIMRMIELSGGSVKVDPKNPQVLLMETGNIGLKEKSEFIKERLSALL